MDLPTTNATINRVLATPWIDVALYEPETTTATKIFTYPTQEENLALNGAYLGKHKHGDIFKAPATVLTQSRFMTPQEFAEKATTKKTTKKATTIEAE